MRVKTMRRSKQEINNLSELDSIIKQSQVCRLGLCDADEPYVVPICFGYDGQILYFHCANEGRKLDVLKKNPNVCFEFDVVGELIKAKKACAFGMTYKSIIGFGQIEFIDDLAEKKNALSMIMSQYVEEDFLFPDKVVEHMCVFKVEIQSMTGKQSD